MHKRSLAAVLFAAALTLSAALPAGCGGGGEGRISEVSLPGTTPQDSFALYYPVSSTAAPGVPAYTVSPDLAGVAGVNVATLPEQVKRTLGLQGFAAVRGGGDSIYQAYLDAAEAKFVTVDALLSAFHSLCAYALRDAEEGSLAADLEGLAGSLYDTAARMYRGSGGEVREAARMDLAYLAVAAGLLGVEVDVPSEVAGLVEDELALIAAHTGTAVSPIFAYSEDYSSYEPHGYYADGGELRGYYQAMTWMGRMAFYPEPGAGPGDIVAGRDMTRRALLLVCALHTAEVDGESAYLVWDRVYQTASYLGSFAHDLNAHTYTTLARELYGDEFPLSRLEDDVLLDEFISRALQERPPLVSSMTGEDVYSSSPAFRLFGEAGFPEDYIIQELVEPRVADRSMPRGLDVPAALGSDRALQVLDQVYAETLYEGYDENMQALRALFRGVDPAQAHSNAYWSCLDVMRLMLKPCGEGYPSFMRAAAWQDRSLYDFLGSWAGMRHCDVDYSASESAVPGGGQAAADLGYVEPCPEAFARLAAATDVVRRGLGERSLASAAVSERLDGLYDLLLALKTMAEKELRGESLSEGEYAAIADIGWTLRYLLTFPRGAEGETAVRGDDCMPLVNDVYFEETYGEVLQTAVGKPVIYYVIAPVAGRPTLTVGAGYSYYEFIKPADGSMTDETWRQAVDAGQLPELPAWTSSFLP